MLVFSKSNNALKNSENSTFYVIYYYIQFQYLICSIKEAMHKIVTIKRITHYLLQGRVAIFCLLTNQMISNWFQSIDYKNQQCYILQNNK